MTFQSKWKKKKEKAANEGNLDELYTACTELAALHINRQEFEDALKEFKEAKRAAEAANNVINVAVSHRMIGEVYSSMQNYDLAIKHQLKYLELARAQGDTVEEQRALANLGHMYLLKADTYLNPEAQQKLDSLNKSKKYSLLSLQTCERLANINKKELTEMQARLYLNLGLTVEQLYETETAISYYNRAINLCKSMDLWEYLCRTYNSLGCLYQHRDDHARALDSFDKALSVAQRLPDKNQHICDLLLLKADILFDLPDFRGAKQCLLKAYKLNTSNRSEIERKLRTVAAVSRYEEKLLDTPDRDLATRKSLYESLGDGCAAMRSFSKALEYYYLMLETAQNMGECGEQLRPCYVSLSQTYKDNKQYDLAIKYFNEELDLNKDNPVEACRTTLSIAEVLELKEADVEEITECYQRARSLAQATGDIKLEARALAALVQLLKDSNRLTDARKMEAELENLKEKYGPIESSSESDEENTPDIGEDININDLSDDEPEETEKARTRRKCPSTKFRRNEKGEYPLHTACINGNLALVKKLLDQGHPVNVRDHSGWLPLHEACNHGFLEIVEVLLDHGAAINDRGSDVCDGVTPLLDAAGCGNLEVMRLLLRRGASPVMRTNKGETVLDCLIAWRKRYIRDMNADLDPVTLDQYNDLIRTLRAALKKAGHKPESDRISLSPPPASQPSSSKRHSGNGFRDLASQRPALSITRRSVGEEDFPSRRSFSDKEKAKSSNSSLRRSSDDVHLRQSSSSSSLRRSTDEIPLRQRTSATKEYEEAMKALRRKHNTPQSSQSPPHSEKSALLEEEEMVDDWLIDDLAPSATSRGVKRRRAVNCFEGEPLRRPNRHTSPLSRSLELERKNTYRPVSPVELLSDSSDSQQQQFQMEGVERNNDDISESTEIASIETTNSSHEPNTRSQQQSSSRATGVSRQAQLSVFGVVRNPIPQPPEPASSTTYQPPSQPSIQPTQNTQMAPLSIKVRVEGKLLLIPLPITGANQEVLTIAWLAEEAAKRYYSFEGVEPKLSLQTEEGAMLSPHDPVTLLLSCREVTAVVTSWKMHRVTERYREICEELSIEVDEYLEHCLDVSQASFSLSLADCSLDAAMVEPVFRASATHTTLQHLVLCDNRLGDEGIQLLAKLVPKLPHLRELDLTCNGITGDGLNIFVHQVVEHQACQRLEILRLSHNGLGKTCTGPLSRLLQVTKGLTCLSLSSVGLTAASFMGSCQLNLERIERLDASLNNLASNGVQALLSRLSVARVVSLHLAHTGSGVPSEMAVWLSRGDPSRLQTLNLASCHDQEQAFTQLVQSLKRAPLLDHLELSFPETMDKGSLQLLYQLPLKVLRLEGVKLGPLPPSVPPPPIYQLSCLSLSTAGSQPPWALRGPFGLLTNNPCPST